MSTITTDLDRMMLRLDEALGNAHAAKKETAQVLRDLIAAQKETGRLIGWLGRLKVGATAGVDSEELGRWVIDALSGSEAPK